MRRYRLRCGLSSLGCLSSLRLLSQTCFFSLARNSSKLSLFGGTTLGRAAGFLCMAGGLQAHGVRFCAAGGLSVRRRFRKHRRWLRLCFRNRLCGRLKFRLCGNRERNLGHRPRRGFLRNGEGYLSRRLVPGERDCIRVRLPSSHRCRRSVLCGALCDGARLSRCGLCFLGLVNLFRQTRFLGTAGFFRQTRFLGPASLFRQTCFLGAAGLFRQTCFFGAAGLFRQTCFFGAPRGLYGALACGGFFGQALLHGGVEINGLPLAFNGRLFGLRRLLYRARRGDGRGGHHLNGLQHGLRRGHSLSSRLLHCTAAFFAAALLGFRLLLGLLGRGLCSRRRDVRQRRKLDGGMVQCLQGGQLRARCFGLALLLGVFAADDLPKRTDFLYLGHQQANGGDTQHHGAYQHHDADGVAEHIAAQQQPRAHAQKAAQRSYREHRRGDFSSQFSSCHIIAPLIERSSPHRGRERFILCRKCGRLHRRDPARCSRSRSAFHPSRPHRCPRRDAPPAGAACLRAQR